MKTTNFTGELFERGVTRSITTTDPATGRDIRKVAKFDYVTGLVIDRVSGMGKSEKTGELQVTLSGQYKPFGTLRITASAQNYEKVINALKGNVNDDKTLKNEITVNAVGTLMRGYGMNVTELYLKEGDKWVPVIAPQESVAKSDAISEAFL